MLFQSMGARYSLGAALAHLFTVGNAQSNAELKKVLSERYDGEVSLYYKGRDALAAGLRVATGGEGSVAVTGLTCYSVVQAVEAAGCTPVYVDIRTEDLHYGPGALEAAIEKHEDVKAVVVQNMLGIPADVVGIEKVCEKYGVVLVEDLAHSAGANYADGREVGTVGDLVMLSFGKDKAVDCVNGGALVVRDEAYTIDRQRVTQPSTIDDVRDHLYPLVTWFARSLFSIGVGKYIMAATLRAGLVVRSADGEVNMRREMSSTQAQRAIKELAGLDSRVRVRKENTKQCLALTGASSITAASAPGASLVRIPYLVRDREGVLSEFKAEGIYVEDVWYDIPVAPVRYYKKAHFPESSCPKAVEIAAQLINIPTHENVTNAEYKKIASVLERFAI